MQSGIVSLRATEPSDLAVMYLYENNTDVWLYSETTRPYSKFTLEEYLKTAHDDIYSARQLRLVIEKKESGVSAKPIGFIDLYDFDPSHRRTGIGILIGDESERRKGYAQTALQLVIQYGFQTLNLHQFYCIIEQSNQKSIELFEKSGFKKSGVLNDWLLNKGTWHSVVMMQHFSTIG